MIKIRKALLSICFLAGVSASVLFGVSACDRVEDKTRHETKQAPEPLEVTNFVEFDATGMRFVGPDTISSGWTTIRLNNKDDMLHFGMLVRLPEHVTATMYSDDLGAKFQQGYNLMLEGRNEEAGVVFGSLPGWVQELSYHGGPGFVSGNMSAESTQYLEPGNYVVECYIKSDQIFHSYSPVPGMLTMMFPMTVTDSAGGMAEPEANATLTINETGMRLTEGALKAGDNSVRVRFDTQIRYPSFVGQDVHVVRVDTDADVRAALDWMDWQKPGGLLVPSPVTFVGGINDVMPAGSTAYFTVDLSPGRYAFISETPEADKKGLLMEFEIP
jgi:hypothetical protein